MCLAFQLVAVLRAESRVLASFLNFGRLFRPRRYLLKSDIAILLVVSLYAEAIEVVMLRAALSASSSELIWILGEFNSEAKL
jgi:hypothetical protein